MREHISRAQVNGLQEAQTTLQEKDRNKSNLQQYTTVYFTSVFFVDHRKKDNLQHTVHHPSLSSKPRLRYSTKSAADHASSVRMGDSLFKRGGGGSKMRREEEIKEMRDR